VEEPGKEKCIIIPNHGEFPAWHFEATVEERTTLMNYGKQAAEQFLVEHQTLMLEKRRPVRRYSCQ
jgi:hypothetical protein